MCWRVRLPMRCRKGSASLSSVENRPGGRATSVQKGRQKQIRMATLFYSGTNGTLEFWFSAPQRTRYDPQKDLVPVGLLHQLPLLLIVNPQVPAKTLGELIAYARSNPGKLTFASAGVGTASHLTAELFKIATGVDIRHTSVQRPRLTTADLISGEVSICSAPFLLHCRSRRGGQMRALGLTTREARPTRPICQPLRNRVCRIRCQRLDWNFRARRHSESRHRAAERGDDADCQRSGLCGAD